MKEILDKLGTYNIFNYLFPGFVFIQLLDITTKYNIKFENIVHEVFVAYFIGIVISRIGSVLIQTVLIKWNFVKFVDYQIFIKSSKVDTKIDLLSEVNNMYRTLCSLFFILLLINLFELLPTIEVLKKYSDILLILFFLILFLLSYRKQTKIIKDRSVVNNEILNTNENENNITNA